jgi:hypothetical protein
MDVKEAVVAAKLYIIELFAEENISDVGLEEVLLDEQAGQWLVTVGFARPWDKVASGFAAALQMGINPRRSYKVVRISDKTGAVVSVKNREGTT